jgi:hypothetical protein
MYLTRVQEPQLVVAGGAGTQGCKDTNFPISLYINICRNMDMYIMTTPKEKEKMEDEIAWGHGNARRAKF